jgi:hypothetical protein
VILTPLAPKIALPPPPPKTTVIQPKLNIAKPPPSKTLGLKLPPGPENKDKR